MMKGQEFSTFKLLIAAVVAIAILGILLQILGGITTPVGFEQQARELLRDARDGGVVRRGPEVPFESGSLYTGGAFSDAAGGGNVEFRCDRGFCDPEGSWGSTLEITGDGDSDFLVCCDDDDTCYIGVGADTDDMTSECGIN